MSISYTSFLGGKITYCGPYSGLQNQSSTSLNSLSKLSVKTSSSSSSVKDEGEKQKAVESKNLLDEEYERDSLIEAESFRAGKFRPNF